MTSPAPIGRTSGLHHTADAEHTEATGSAQAAQASTATARPASAQTVVENHPGEPERSAGPSSNSSGPTLSAAELAQQSRLQAAMARTLGRLDDSLEKLAKAPRGEQDAAALGVANAASGAGFLEFAARIDRDQVRASVQGRLRACNPALSEKDLEALTAKAMKHLDQVVNRQATDGLRHLAAKKLSGAASHFRETAKSGDALGRLSKQLALLERPGASAAERAAANTMRAGLGLGEAVAPTPENVKQALLQRADLMDREAAKVDHAGDNTLFRRLLTHDVQGLFAEELGARPGSWAAAGITATHARGVQDVEDLKAAKLMTSLAFAAVTGGAGAGVLLGMGGVAAANAPDVAMAWHAIDSAAAAGSAGTSAPDAEAVARHNAQVATGEAGVSVALAGAGGVFFHGAEFATPGAHMVAHVAGELLGHQVAEAGAHPFEAERGEGDGEDAVSRAQRK